MFALHEARALMLAPRCSRQCTCMVSVDLMLGWYKVVARQVIRSPFKETESKTVVREG